MIEATLQENIELPLLYNNVPASERKQRVNELLEKIDNAFNVRILIIVYRYILQNFLQGT